VHWTPAGAEAASRPLQRVWRLADEIGRAGAAGGAAGAGEDALALTRAGPRAIRDVTADIEAFGFNRAVARLYDFTNTIARATSDAPGMAAARVFAMRTLAQLMAPMVPHLAEEVWARVGGVGLVASAAWPEADPAMLAEASVTLPVQVNGKRRAEIVVPAGADRATIEAVVLADATVQRLLDGASPKKLVVVPDRIVNVVL
jgi:leucyl-tRNA synthetase